MKDSLWRHSELVVLYTKVHEAMEGRYKLTGSDLFEIESALASYAEALNK